MYGLGMHAGDRYSTGAVPEVARRATSPSGPLKGQALQAGHEQRSAPAARRRAWAALAWAAGAAALFVLFLRITLADPRSMSSDPANSALQAWDMLHGHLLLHGWIVGDATFYTLELPLIAIAEMFFGLHIIAVQVAVALVYVAVAACAVAIAVTDSRGASRAVRAGVTVAVLAAPALIASDAWIPLGFPDHTGTSLFLLVSFLLVDRATAWRFTAPLLCLILCAGQISDVTVRYVAVPAIVVVCGYRALAARKIAIGDAANLTAAVVSVPLSLAVRALMRHAGGYLMVAPKTGIAPVSRWPQNAAMTWHALRVLFGIQAAPNGSPAGLAAIFGFGCLLVAVAGMVRVLWRWRTARRAEQLLLVAIIVNLGAYTISTLPNVWVPHDIVAVLPAGAILGARALVPARIAGRPAALAATGVAAFAALLPLSLAATRPAAIGPEAQLTTWLQAHGLRYGLGDYWDGSAVTLQSDGQVDVRTVLVTGQEIAPWAWEMYRGWYDPARHYANFIVIDLVKNDLGPEAEPFFGKPVSTHRVAGWEILIYHRNLLEQLKPPRIGDAS
jgi:hypothetical protein